MGKIMIRIVNVPDADSPSSEAVPALHFNYAVTCGFDRKAVMGKDIRTFMNPPSTEAAGISPRASVAVIGSDRKRECMLAQINMAVGFKQLHEFRYNPHCLITPVIIPKPDPDVVFICAIRQ